MSAMRALDARLHYLACDVDDVVVAIRELPVTDELLYLSLPAHHLAIALRALEELLGEVDTAWQHDDTAEQLREAA